MKCPCCKRPLFANIDVIASVDARTAAVAWNQRIIDLREPKLAKLFEVLADKFTMLVEFDLIIAKLWDNPPINALLLIRIYVCKLQKIIRPFGLQIDNEYGVGYRMVRV